MKNIVENVNTKLWQIQCVFQTPEGAFSVIPLLYLQGCFSTPMDLARAVTLCMVQGTAMY